MDFYYKNFQQLIRRLDPSGILNVPVTVFTDIKCLDRYFRTNRDFQKLNVPWMCDQLVTLLANFDDVAIISTIPHIQNDFQYIKYTFFFVSQAFIGLILLHNQSIKAYCSYCRSSTIYVFKNKISRIRVPKTKKKKKNTDDQSYRNILIENQLMYQNSQNQNQVILTDKVTNEFDFVLLPHQPIGEFSVINPNRPIEYPQFSNELEQLMAINVIQPKHMEFQESVEQSQIANKLQENKIETDKFTEQPKSELNQQEKNKEIPTENDSSQNNLNNQSGKRKRSSKLMKENYKKRPIEQSSKLLKNGLKTLEGKLFDRPLEHLELKYFYQPMNHLPLRYAAYRNKLNIPFAVLTLSMELEENKNQDDVFNNEMTKSSFKAICEKSSFNLTTNSCIYQQCLNNELPHLSLLPLAEECLTNNSLVWRKTINEINKKLEDSLKDFQNSITDQNKWDEFKEKMKLRVNHSLVAHKTLIGHELSHIDVPHHLVDFPSPCQIDVPETELGLLPSGNSQRNSINEDNYDLDQFDLNGSQNTQKSFVQTVETHHKQSVNIVEIISHVLQQSSEKTSYLIFTDLCPIHLTERKHASLVFRKLLGLHRKRIVALSQPLNITEPSSISIELNIQHFF